ncbi:MAG: hypothetical protein WC835_02910 [Candidatus Paceibacterota bacterium]|jgi:hypothetical protein
MEDEQKYKKFNKLLNEIPLEELHARNDEELAKSKKDFENHKALLSQDKCYYCGYSISHFSDSKPCFHWLLKPKGFKKKHFPILYQQKSFHQIESYLRWTANCIVPLYNINDLVEERSPSKIIEETIRYKNIEWSFSCSKNDMRGHASSHEGTVPHYHFQMKIDGQVVINYNSFHIPFSDYDHFCFAVESGKFDRLKGGHIEGAGMQTLFDRFTPEELLDLMKKSPDDDESKMQYNIQTMLTADEGTTMSGDDIADIIDEHNKTGVPIAKLIRKLKNVSATSIITPGPGVPEIAARTPNRQSKSGLK